jgi:glucose/arabinose dehydrogenase
VALSGDVSTTHAYSSSTPSPEPMSPMTRHCRLLAAALFAACGSQSPEPDVPSSPELPVLTAPTLSRSVVLSGVSGPWDVAFLPDGAMLFTEKCRGLSVRSSDGTVTRLFGTTGSALVTPDLVCEGQSGAHGVAVDPQFASNRRLYLFMASSLSTPRTNRVVRMVLSADGRSVSARTDIITDIAFKHVGNPHGGAGAHSGGRLRFGPDRLLYVATGDNHSGVIPQSPTLLGGKVLRVTTDGAAAPGNNAPTGFDRRIYTYGHRNVQGIDFRPGSGVPYVAEHGPGHADEVTALRAGGNGGWDPKDRPGLTCASGYCGYSGNSTAMPMTDTQRFPDAMPPAWTNNNASQGMGPATFLVGTQWGSWNGRLAVGIMGAQRLDILSLDTAGNGTGVTSSGLPSARYRGLTQGPDGNLYVATDGGEIWRVTPTR